MCGIIGFNFKDDELACQMLGSIAHRGPDDEGFFSDGKITIGNRRLAIIDLSSAGHQPMNLDKTLGGGIWIVFNGEIYNFKELRQELVSKGYRFLSNTDTEVILCGYKVYGDLIFEKLRGMWGVAIYDSQKGKLILSRDFFGIKPLYYYHDGKNFVFGSEIKTIKKFIDKNQLRLRFSPLATNSYFVLGYTPHPLTIFEEIKKISPGEILTFDINSQKISSRFLKWQEDSSSVSNSGDFEKVMLESVEKHLMADVPVGVFLSGGVDSTLVALLLKKLGKKLKAFTVNIRGRHDAEFAKKIADFAKLDHQEVIMDENNFEEMYQRVFQTLDEPIADTSLFSSLLVSREAAKSVKVVLTGEGGDELFLGYQRYNIIKELSVILRPNSFITFLDKLRQPHFKAYLRYLRPLLRRLRLYYNKRHRKDLLGTYFDVFAIDSDMGNRLSVQKYLGEKFAGEKADMAFFDEKLYLPNDLLYKTDFATMNYSIEGRVPILDRSVYAFVKNLHVDEKLSDGISKKIVKDYLAKNLPPELVFRQKEGFSLPLRPYLFKNHEQEIKEAISYLLDKKIDGLSSKVLARALKDKSYFELLREKFSSVLFSALVFYKVSKQNV